MATQSRRAQHQASTDDTTQAAQAALSTGFNSVADLTRQQLAFSAETLSAFFRAAEVLQQAQVHMAQRAVLLHRQAAENLRKAETPLEVLSVQANLVTYQFQEGMRFLQEMMVAGAKAGSDAGTRVQEREQDPTSEAASAAAQVMEAAMNAAGPMAQAWQQMFAAPLNGATAAKHH